MITIASLWLPILLSAVIVWIASALVWTVLPHHKKHWKPVSREEEARSALKNLPPGLYTVPHVESQAAMRNPEIVRKMQEGPIAYITIIPSGTITMGGKMAASFVYYLVVGVVVAYVASRTLAPGTEYLRVFQIVGTTAWLAYAFAVVPDSIWFGKPWSFTIKHFIDTLAYALLTAGIFGWRWPAT